LEKIVSISTWQSNSRIDGSFVVAEFAEAERDAQLAAMDVRSSIFSEPIAAKQTTS
jgi:hypothetical protein